MAGPNKLRFSILSCTGEDPDYPVRELLYHSPQTRGWQVPRFCKYPQELVLQLAHPSRIHQIQILSHEYKIATKLQIYVGMPSPGDSDPVRAPMRRLGHLSFDSNERSNHQARELKSVHVNTTAQVFKLVVDRCHVNKLNIYNQVGIVALNLIGEPLGPHELAGAGGMPPAGGGPNHPAADVAMDMGVDSKTAAKIRELRAQKEAAVSAEDYDEAKRIKAAIDRLKSVGAKIGSLEAKKAAAVQREDYDTAKQLKADIDKLHAAAEQDGFYVAGSSSKSLMRSKDPQEIFERVLDAAGGPPPGPDQAGAETDELESDQVSPLAGGEYFFDPETAGPEGIPPPGNSRVLHSRQGNSAVPLPPQGYGYEAYDERPAMGKGAYRLNSPSVQAMQNRPPPVAPDESGLAKGIRSAPPPGFPPDLPTPEELSSADAVVAEPLVELLGEYVTTCLFAKNWQLREAGMQMIERSLNEGRLPKGANPRDELRQLTKVVCWALKDKVANVFQEGLTNMRCLLDTYGQQVSSKDLLSSSSEFVPLLVEKAGDNNSRMQALASEGLLYLAATPGIEQILAPLVCKPAKTQTAWKPVLARLNLIQQLCDQFGVHAKGGGNGLPLDGVMNYIAAAFSSPNGDVRSQAVKCATDIYRHVGNAMRAFLPQEMNKALRDQLEAALEECGDAPPPTKPGPASTSQPKAKQATSKHRDPPREDPGRTPAPSAAPRPPPAAEEPSIDDGVGMEEDPQVYEEELAMREEELGPEHPDVAESLSNLAILYNQKGEYDKAQPLYERALAIFERTQGKHSSDVAHTLTDLAVLHLEQGRDSEGRPLLERALAIQRANLGDDHPDVIAILEVLESDD